jgi:hypothetical protein
MCNKTTQKAQSLPSSLIQKLVSLCLFVLYAIYCYIKLFYRFIIPQPLKSLDGEIFLISGSGSGIGKAVALYLAKFFPTVTLILWDNNAHLNHETAKEVRALGAKVYEYEVDVTDRKKVQSTALKVCYFMECIYAII